MAYEAYANQVQLLVDVLPVIAREPDFALKGGTAINLFYRDLPRLSVDIDLTYLPVKDRESSLKDINARMGRIAENGAAMPGIEARRIAGGGGNPTRVQFERDMIRVKVETSPVTRGVVFTPEVRRVSEAVEDRFGFAETQLVAFEDLYAGKLHAALDRQHPRDLFDVKLLYENEGLTDDLFRAFLVYVASSSRPPHELLNPNLLNLEKQFAAEFDGMTTEPVALEDLDTIRQNLVTDIQGRLCGSAAEFLRTLAAAQADFELIELPEASHLPAVRWKMMNLEKLKETNTEKFEVQRTALEALLH